MSGSATKLDFAAIMRAKAMLEQAEPDEPCATPLHTWELKALGYEGEAKPGDRIVWQGMNIIVY